MHVFGEFDATSNLCIVDEQHNYIVLHPDLLITATNIGSSFSCSRRAVLGELFRTAPISADQGSNTDANAHLLLYGSLIHSLFQSALVQQDFSKAALEAAIDKAIASSIVALYAVNRDHLQAQEELRAFVPLLQRWATRYFMPGPSSVENAYVHTVVGIEENIWSPKCGLKGKIDASVVVVQQQQQRHQDKVQPGKARPRTKPEVRTVTAHVAPLELKTGKLSAESGSPQHRAQVMLYSVMMGDRYGCDIPQVLPDANHMPDISCKHCVPLMHEHRDVLVASQGYLQHAQAMGSGGTPSMIPVETRRNEVALLLQARNDISAFLARWFTATRESLQASTAPQPAAAAAGNRSPTKLKDGTYAPTTVTLPPNNALGRLPPMIQNANLCKSCSSQAACFMYTKAEEPALGQPQGSSPMAELFRSRTKHLTPADTKFFWHWDRLLDMESSEMLGNRLEVWSMSSRDRERLGKCFSHMELRQHSQGADPTIAPSPGMSNSAKAAVAAGSSPSALDPCSPAIEQPRTSTSHWYRFHTLPFPDRSPRTSFFDLSISKGDLVVISSEDGYYGLGQGFVVELSTNSCTIAADDLLGVPPQPVTVRPGVCDIEDLVSAAMQRRDPKSGVVWRIDKIELNSGFAMVKDCWYRFFLSTSKRDQQLRRSIVALVPPRFAASESSLKILEGLNAGQQNAIRKALAAKEYALILGMPGTGKSFTMARLIMELVSRGKRVLLASYTHWAVDTLLLKLVQVCGSEMASKVSGLPYRRLGVQNIVRLGRGSQVHPSLRSLALDESQFSTTEQLHGTSHRCPNDTSARTNRCRCLV